LHRLVVDTDVTGEDGIDHVRRCRQLGDRLAFGIAAGAVDRVDGDRLETKLLGGFTSVAPPARSSSTLSRRALMSVRARLSASSRLICGATSS